MKKRVIYPIIAILLSISIPLLVKAQGPGGPGGSPDEVPIDGGLSVLIAVGVGYGIKKVRDGRKKGKTSENDK